MTIVHHVAQVIQNCPQCRKPKSPEKMGAKWVVACKVLGHGHMAMGDDYETAVSNWNKYIAYVVREAALDMDENIQSGADFSYCVYCKKQSANDIRIAPRFYEINCRNCGLVKISNKS